MRILLVNWQDPHNPQAGGAEVHLHEVFRRIHHRGHPVTWLVSGWTGASGHATVDGMEVHRSGSRYTFGLTSIPYFHRHLADRQFDLVVEAVNKVPLYSPLWSRLPVVLLVHHLFGTTAFREAPLTLAAATWLQERPLRHVYAGVPIEAISYSTAADLVDRGLDPARIEVIQPGVDVDFFTPSTSPARLQTPTFVYLGRLQKYKRVDVIIEAFARIAQARLAARLIIAGRGDQMETLRTLADRLGVGDRVAFEGYVSEERKRELLRGAWANLFASPKEGWGITNLEAGGCGTATIASDSPGLRESVVHEVTGLLVPHGDVTALADALERFAADPAMVERLGAAARDFASRFTWDRTAAATERHLAGVLERSPGAAARRS